jgi:curli biogenesis system outer membrane secretion channel CsgG
MDRKNIQLILIPLMILISCATTQNTSSQPVSTPSNTRENVSLQTQPTQPIHLQYTGPKKRIGVIKFDAVGSFTAQYGGWDVGGGLAAELTTALINSGRFLVVERGELASVLREQEMGLQKIISKETAAQVSHLLGAQLLVRGAVTEFDQQAGGGGLHVGVGTGMFGGGLGSRTTHGIVGMDIRVIDTTTGQVIQSHRVEAKVSATGISADINVREVTFGGDKFNKTPLGDATRKAIDQAVAFIIKAMEPIPWAGRIVEVNGDQVYINAGTNAGLKPGDHFTVSTIVRELTDPESGALLGIEEVKLGELQVENVQEKFSIGRMQAPFQTKRGDLVKYSGG